MGKNKMVTKVDKKTGETKLTKHGRALKNKLGQEQITKNLIAMKFAFKIRIKDSILNHLEKFPHTKKDNLVIVIPREAISLFKNEIVSFTKEDEFSKEIIKEVSEKIINLNSAMAETDTSCDENDNAFVGEFKLYATQEYKHKFPDIPDIYGDVVVTTRQYLLGVM